MRSCKRSKYWYVWGAAMIVPLVRTGWIVIDADGAIIVTIGATASGTPMGVSPAEHERDRRFFHPRDQFGDGKPRLHVAADGVEQE